MATPNVSKPLSKDDRPISEVQRIGNTRLALVLAIAVLLIGVISQHFIIIWAGFFILMLMILAEQMAGLTFRHLSLKHQFARSTAEIDEPLDAELIVENPLPWPVGEISWELDVPESLRFHSQVESSSDTSSGYLRIVRGALTVTRQERLRVPYQLVGMRRGRFQVGPNVLIFQDPLNWSQWVRRTHMNDRLTIWPRRYTLPQGFWQAHPELGERRGRPWDPPDPVLVAGIRPYRIGDPIRRIHAHASAQAGQLMVKEDEHLTARTVEVLLHPQTGLHPWSGVDRGLMEESVSLAATVVETSLAQGLDVGLTTSGILAGHPHGLSLSPKHGSDIRSQMLTALAWVEPSGNMTDNLLRHLLVLKRRVVRGGLIVVVAPIWPEEVQQDWAALRARGVEIIWITVGNEQTIPVPGASIIWRWQEGSWSRE